MLSVTNTVSYIISAYLQMSSYYAPSLVIQSAYMQAQLSKLTSGIRAWHIANNVPYQGSVHLAYVLKGIEKLTPSTSHQSPRPPVTLQMMITLTAALDKTDPFDACVDAASKCAFWGQARSSELLSPWKNSFNLTEIPSTAMLLPPCTPPVHIASYSQVQKRNK